MGVASWQSHTPHHTAMFLFSLLLATFSASKVVGFVVRENRVEVEMGEKEKEEHEVVVTYGDELESILRKAADEGRKSLIEEILNGEIQALQSWVRKRGFEYMEEGVTNRGEDIEAAKEVIDDIKAVLEETNNLLSGAGQEITSFLKSANFGDPSTSETLVNVLKFLRSAGETAENKYKAAISERV